VGKAMAKTVAGSIVRFAEFQGKDQVEEMPKGARGIYVLYDHQGDSFDVVYVGLSKTGMRIRLLRHRQSREKSSVWTHFSVFQVHDHISNAQINELEGLFRQIYRRDSRANRLNKQKTHGPLKRVRMNNLAEWPGRR